MKNILFFIFCKRNGQLRQMWRDWGFRRNKKSKKICKKNGHPKISYLSIIICIKFKRLNIAVHEIKSGDTQNDVRKTETKRFWVYPCGAEA